MATTEIYTLSLHDALPICWPAREPARWRPDAGTVRLRAAAHALPDRKSTRLNSSHSQISYAVFCLKKKKRTTSPPLSDGHPPVPLLCATRSLLGRYPLHD